jgi:hypothetical protein
MRKVCSPAGNPTPRGYLEASQLKKFWRPSERPRAYPSKLRPAPSLMRTSAVTGRPCKRGLGVRDGVRHRPQIFRVTEVDVHDGEGLPAVE